jgi:hypothetical protein
VKKEINGPYYIVILKGNKECRYNIPEVPKMGKLELKQIEKSKYMIC